MDFSSFDLSRGMDKIPDGMHEFVITEASESEGSSGWPYVKFTLECQSNESWGGQNVFAIVSLSPAARWKLEEFLDAVEAPATGQATALDFIGQTVHCLVQTEEYTKADGSVGKSPQVKSFVRAGSEPTTPTTEGSLDMDKLGQTQIPDDVIE